MSKRVKKNLKAFVEPIGEQINENIKPVIKAAKSSLNNDKNQDEVISKIIDILEVPEEKKKELIKSLQNGDVKERKFSNLESFLLVYKNDRYKRLAESLRKELSNNRYIVNLVTYKQFKSRINIATDFIVFFDNLDEIPNDNFTMILDEFGCKIMITDKRQFVVTYGKSNDFNLDEFIEYYKTVTKASIQKQDKLEKLIKERQEKEPFDIKIFDKRKELLNKIDKKIKLKVSSFQSGNNFQKAIYEINDKISPVLLNLSIMPTNITELVIEKTVNSIIDSNFDSRFTDEAKEQIIITKFFEYIQKCQISG